MDGYLVLMAFSATLYRKGGKRKGKKVWEREEKKDEEARNYFPVLTISLPKSNVSPSFALEGTEVLRDAATGPRSQSQECVRSQHLNHVCKFYLSPTLALKRMLSKCVWSLDGPQMCDMVFEEKGCNSLEKQ